jgi:hypothetical protein
MSSWATSFHLWRITLRRIAHLLTNGAKETSVLRSCQQREQRRHPQGQITAVAIQTIRAFEYSAFTHCSLAR